jgi:hypothetical protein
VFGCQKPAWFTAPGPAPLRPAHGAAARAPLAGAQGALALADAPHPCAEWAEGCAEDLAAALDRGWARCAGDRGKARALFAGDHLFGDVAAGAAFGWRAAAVVQELEEEAPPQWAALLEGGAGEATFWAALLQREAAHTVSDVEALPGLEPAEP